MAYEDIYKGLTEEEKERMLKMDIPKFEVVGEFEMTEEENGYCYTGEWACAFPQGYVEANSEEEAIEFINEIKKKHKDATHNVWAYTIGENMNIQRYSDDGEPQGTAGIPTLEVIKKEDLRDVVVVVTRYFGGIKLGAGGLVRAYTKGAKVGIEAGIVIEKVKYSEVKIKIEYTQLGRIQNEIMNLGFKVKDTIYSEDVELIVYVRNEEAQSLMDRIIDITSGTADVSLGEEYYLSEKDGELIL